MEKETIRWRVFNHFSGIMLIVLLISSNSELNAQKSSSSAIQRLSFEFGFGNHTTGLPFQNLFSSINPAITDIGVRYQFNRKPKNIWEVSSQFSLFDNKTIGQTVMAGVGIHFKYLHKTGLFTSSGMHFSQIIQLHPKQTYRYNASSGEFVKKDAMPKISPALGFDITVGYDFSVKKQAGFAIYLRNKFILQTSYFDVKNFPIMPQNVISAGVAIKLKK